MARERQFNVKLSLDEEERLRRLSEHYGLNEANVLRLLLKKEMDALEANARRRIR